MLESPAWRVLSLSARRLIERIEIELGHHGGNDNDALPVTYADFLAYGLADRSSVAAARREAVALGFLRFKPGRGGNREFRRPDLFGLTFSVLDPTHDWRKIETFDDARAIAGLARKAKDPRAVAIGRERARRRAKKQNTGLEKPQVSVGEYQTETSRLPVGESRTTASVGKTGLLSISGDGVRSAPARSAVASAPSPAPLAPSEEMLDLIVRLAGCTRPEALERFEAVPELSGADAPAPQYAASGNRATAQPSAIQEDLNASAYFGA